MEDEKNASALDTSVLNDSNKSSQKLLEVSSEIDYDANSPLKEGTTRDSLNYESFALLLHLLRPPSPWMLPPPTD